MKTIALKEKTFDLLNELKKLKGRESFDELVFELIIERDKVPDSMFGFLKGKTGGFTPKERKKIWNEKY